MKVFGYSAYVHITEQYRDKLEHGCASELLSLRKANILPCLTDTPEQPTIESDQHVQMTLYLQLRQLSYTSVTTP
ncbi:Hypothetical protein PHPALM_8486 [Phytophthora palmivora]|uniref:Uncharacterized protein n=1 Tax=Phytophthora palmivora TaxID=4796 RepID=A0A2P4Y9Q5_9STRA|nr:Hypothetical protein PHPALM_8486 [Phytophthora palmivora]